MNGIAKSPAQEVLAIVTETIADAYALLLSISPNLVRKDDCRRDVSYVTRRFDSEGLAFLTVTLPRLGEWMDSYVRGEPVTRVEGFAPFDGLFPTFLRPFWLVLREEYRPEAHPYERVCINPATYNLVRILRTLLFGLKKLEVPSTDEQKTVKLRSFLAIEEDLRTYPIYPSPVIWRAQTVLEDLLKGYEPICNIPRHGPGSVAGGERGNQKWEFSVLFESLHAQYPYYDFHFGVRSLIVDRSYAFHEDIVHARPYPLQLAVQQKKYLSMKRVSEPTARLLFVPKDSRGPRVIACEPVELMFIQQGVARYLMSYIENHVDTRGHVNFFDQSINGSLALSASADKAWATIDLSDASDRVGCELISLLFPQGIVKKWFALRSTAVKLPCGTRVPLKKFASMGSAMCFPVESITFWALAVGCVWEHTMDRQHAYDSVYVFGDDIIVADAYAELVIKALESAHLKVNRSKSFVGDSPFRESCGVEALNGFNVTPCRVKKFPAQRPSDGEALVAYVKYAENSAGLAPRRSRQLLRLVERLIGRIPRTPVEQPFISIVDPTNFWNLRDYKNPKWDPHACYYRANLYTIKNRSRFDPMDSWSRLLHGLTTRVDADPSLVVDRSSTQIRRRHVEITYLERGGLD